MERFHYYVAHHRAGLMELKEWVVYLHDKEHTLQRFATQTEAAAFARKLAETDNAEGHDAQVHVQRPDGRFRTEWTYGDDPARYPG